MAEVAEYTQCLDPLDEQEILDQVYKLRDVQREACKPKPKPTVELNLSELRLEVNRLIFK